MLLSLFIFFIFFNLTSFIILLCGPFLLLFGKQVEKWMSRDHQNYHERYPDKKSNQSQLCNLIWVPHLKVINLSLSENYAQSCDQSKGKKKSGIGSDLHLIP